MSAKQSNEMKYIHQPISALTIVFEFRYTFEDNI